MVKVTLYNEEKDQTIELQNLVVTDVGRGFFECQDKRVSRKHGELTVQDTKLKVKACHVNPIFYKKSGESRNEILQKNEEVLLSHKDKFSLLPNELEYEIRVVEDQEISENRNRADTSASANGADNEDEAGPSTCALARKRSLEGQGAGEVQAKRHKSQTPDLDRPSSAGPLTRRRTLALNASDDNSARRKSPDAALPAPVNSETSQLSVNTPSQQQAGSSKSIPIALVKPAMVVKTEPSWNKIQPSSSSTSQVSSQSNVKPDPDGPVATPTPQSSNSSKPVVKGETLKLKSEAESSKPNPASSTPSPNQASIAPAVAFIVPTPIRPANQPAAAPNANQPAAASSSGQPAAASTAGQPSIRSSCQYGIGCYNRDHDHRRDLAHPYDIDYRRPEFPQADANTPRCPFWDRCYRRNPAHFQQLQHPPSNIYANQRPQPAAPVAAVNVVIGRQALIGNGDGSDQEDLDDSDADANYRVEDMDEDDDGISSASASVDDDNVDDEDLDDEENNLEE